MEITLIYFYSIQVVGDKTKFNSFIQFLKSVFLPLFIYSFMCFSSFTYFLTKAGIPTPYGVFDIRLPEMLGWAGLTAGSAMNHLLGLTLETNV